MHRYEPQALRLLPGGNLAIDVADDKPWLANHQGLFATLAVTALRRRSLARRPRPLWLGAPQPAAPRLAGRASGSPPPRRWTSSPSGALPADLAGYDTADPLGAQPHRAADRLDRPQRPDDLRRLPPLLGRGRVTARWTAAPTTTRRPARHWDNLFWCSAWTDYHNTVSTAPIWAMRTGEVEWLDEIAFPGALRTLHTQIMQCSPTERWFYCGQSPAGYGAYRTDFNSSHAYFENLYLYYWLTGDQTVIDILQRGGDSMRRWMCPQRGPGPVLSRRPGRPGLRRRLSGQRPDARFTGRVGQQWLAVFRFIGLASDDASFLDDFRSGLRRADHPAVRGPDRATASTTASGAAPPGCLDPGGTYDTDSQWTIGMYDMHYLEPVPAGHRRRAARHPGHEARAR